MTVIAAFVICALLSLQVAADATGISAGFNVVKNRAEDAAKLELKLDLEIGADEAADDIFGRIQDIAVWEDGSIFVLDSGFKRIQRFASDGTFLGSIGQEGEGPGSFVNPTAISIDAWGDLMVASMDRISFFAADGSFRDEFRHGLGGSYIRSIRSIPGEGVFVTGLDILEQKVIHKFDADHNQAGSFCDSYAVGTDTDTRLEQTFGGGTMDIGPNGDIYYTQLTPYQIRKYTPTGELLLIVERENDFMYEPEMEKRADGAIIFRMCPASYAVVVVGTEHLINVVKIPKTEDQSARTVIDLFSTDGALVATSQTEDLLTPRCSDSAGRIYATNYADPPTVRRYELAVNN